MNWTVSRCGEFTLEADSFDSFHAASWFEIEQHCDMLPIQPHGGKKETIQTLKWQNNFHVKRCQSFLSELAVI